MFYHPAKRQFVLKNTGDLKIYVVFCLQIGPSLVNIPLNCTPGCWSPAFKTGEQGQFRVSQCDICDEQRVTWAVFFQILRFPLPISFYKCSIFIFLYTILLPESKSPKLRTCQRMSVRQPGSIKRCVFSVNFIEPSPFCVN
jgi:hypothetical protein